MILVFKSLWQITMKPEAFLGIRTMHFRGPSMAPKKCWSSLMAKGHYLYTVTIRI